MKLLKRVFFDDLDEELDSRGLEIPSEIVEFMGDLLEDNESVDFSYFGTRITGNGEGEIKFSECDIPGFVVLSDLTEADLDNIKIYGFNVAKCDYGNVINGIYVENVSSSNAFERTKLW